MDSGIVTTKVTTLLIGVGGAGGNALTGIIEFGELDVDTMALDQDKKRIDEAVTDFSFFVRDVDDLEIEEIVSGYDSVFLVSGLGGRLGSELTPTVSEIVKEAGVKVSVFVFLPFEMEGEYRRKRAEEAVRKITEHTDRVYTCDNQMMMDRFDDDVMLSDLFVAADKALSGLIAKMIEKSSPVDWVDDAGLWGRRADSPGSARGYQGSNVVEIS